MSDIIPLHLLQYFVCTADKLNFTQASDSLGITKSKLSKEIRKLEKLIDISVLERSSRVVRLTEAGQLLYQRAVVLLEDANHLRHDIQTLHHGVSGRLALAASPALGRYISQFLLPTFKQQWPEISLTLKLSYDFENLFQQNLDMAFRIGRNLDQNLIQRQIGLSNRVLVASPSYLQSHAPITNLQELRQHKSVQFFESGQQTWTLCYRSGTEQVLLDPAFQCEDFESVLHMVEAGAGIAQLPWFIVKQKISNQTLQLVLPGIVSPTLPIYVVYRKGYNKPAKLQKFLDWIEANQDLFNLVHTENSSG
ncbi:LysR family transcriptional regulator [Neptunicella marina]|uniref:LysR family transcriptional regulator n=1 Tax=Neptunicella marina TaxID=2125989 RepID=A0A8J6IWL0_9ALTE|nr:LysR family transcriptional regulator [Neptunicella marina]MBC3766693.1 LysR family transcriptional regulator [Neptunicella marina]